jgi:hypothetical protein
VSERSLRQSSPRISIEVTTGKGNICWIQATHKGKLGKSLDVLTGVRQDCIISPILFIFGLDSIMREAPHANQINGSRSMCKESMSLDELAKDERNTSNNESLKLH